MKAAAPLHSQERLLSRTINCESTILGVDEENRKQIFVKTLIEIKKIILCFSR
jgi:hypothetical protein